MLNTNTKHCTLIFALYFIFSGCGPVSSSENSDGTESQDTTKLETELITEPKENWNYYDTEDEMTGEKRYFGECKSTNTIDFEFPYNGGSTMTIVVRNMNKKNELIVMIDNGQFMSNIGDDEYLRIKFDDEQPMNVSYAGPADHSTEYIFPNNAAKLISKLKTAKKVMLEAPFYNSGRQIGQFNVEGFTWDK